MKDKGGSLRAPFIIALIPHLAASGNYLQIETFEKW